VESADLQLERSSSVQLCREQNMTASGE